MYTANQTNLNRQKVARNSPLRLICRAVRTILVIAIQQYTVNVPVSLQIQKQEPTTYTKEQPPLQQTVSDKSTTEQTIITQSIPKGKAKSS